MTRVEIDFSELQKIVKELADDQVREAAEGAQAFAKSVAPVKTGNYRDNIRVEKVSNSEYEVIADTEYADIVESRSGTMQKAAGSVGA